MATDLLEREQQAGNEADNLNPGQKDSDATFSRNTNNHENIEGYDRSADGLDAYDEKEFGERKPSSYTDSHGDTVRSNYQADEPDLTENANNQEQKGGTTLYNGGQERKKKESQKTRKFSGFGPTGGIFAVILLGMASTGFGILGMFASLAVNFKDLLTNDQANHSRVTHIYHKAMYASKFTKGSCSGKLPIFCRFQTVSERQIKKLERAGFTVERGTKNLLGTRSKVISMTFPDGQVATSGRDFHRIGSSSIDNARAIRLATNGKTAFYLNSKMFDVYNRFGINKLKKLTGKTKSDLDKQVDKNTNGTSEEGDDETRRKAAEDKSKEETKKATDSHYNKFAGDLQRSANRGGNLALVAMAVCGVYNMSNRALAFAKGYHMEQLVKYASLFMTEADAIKDQGDTSPEAVSYIGNKLTAYENNPTNEDGSPNEKYNKNATDSIAYRTMTHNDKSETPDYAKEYRAGGYRSQTKGGWLDEISNYKAKFEQAASFLRPENAIHASPAVMAQEVVQAVLNKPTNPLEGLKDYAKAQSGRYKSVEDGREAIRYACAKAPEAALLSFIVVCGVAFLNLFGIVTTGPAVGTLIMCGIGAACMGRDYIPDWVPVPGMPKCSDVLKEMLKYGKQVSDDLGATDYVLGLLQSTVVGSFIKGVDAGEAIGAGYSFFSSTVSSAYGLRPAKDATEATKFISSTQEDMKFEEQLAYEDARATPFNISNRHSLFGSVVWSLQPYFDKQAPVFSSFVSVLGAIPNAIKSQDPTVKAYYTQPVQTSMQRYDCEDLDLKSIGIAKTDRFCSTVGVITEGELESARKQADDENNLIEENLKYMTETQTKNEPAGGTYDDSFCDIDLSKCEEHHKSSKKASIDENGKVVEGSQYAKYIEFCSEKRTAPFGMMDRNIQEAKSTRDIKWFTGQQCLEDTNMMVQFRTFYDMCTQSATMDDTENCDSDEAAKQVSSACAGGGNTAIYTCALKYDDYGYKWGGGHSDIPNATDWIAKFNAGEVPKWTSILDCSGLVRVAYVEAMGIEDDAYVAPGGYDSSKNWDQISVNDVQKGDIITQDGHVAIVEVPPADGKIRIFHASTSNGAIENNILHGEVDVSSVIGAYRAKKGT